MHCSVSETNGLGGEFVVTGNAKAVTNPQVREEAAKIVGHDVPSRYNLFEFLVESALSIEYDVDRKPIARRWKAK